MIGRVLHQYRNVAAVAVIASIIALAYIHTGSDLRGQTGSVSGACCDAPGGTCTLETKSDCTGVYYGDGVACPISGECDDISRPGDTHCTDGTSDRGDHCYANNDICDTNVAGCSEVCFDPGDNTGCKDCGVCEGSDSSACPSDTDCTLQTECSDCRTITYTLIGCDEATHCCCELTTGGGNCGDGTCSIAHEENPMNCSTDCTCGDGVCNGWEPPGGFDTSHPLYEDAANCPEDCAADPPPACPTGTTCTTNAACSLDGGTCEILDPKPMSCNSAPLDCCCYTPDPPPPPANCPSGTDCRLESECTADGSSCRSVDPAPASCNAFDLCCCEEVTTPPPPTNCPTDTRCESEVTCLLDGGTCQTVDPEPLSCSAAAGDCCCIPGTPPPPPPNCPTDTDCTTEALCLLDGGTCRTIDPAPLSCSGTSECCCDSPGPSSVSVPSSASSSTQSSILPACTLPNTCDPPSECVTAIGGACDSRFMCPFADNCCCVHPYPPSSAASSSSESSSLSALGCTGFIFCDAGTTPYCCPGGPWTCWDPDVNGTFPDGTTPNTFSSSSAGTAPVTQAPVDRPSFFQRLGGLIAGIFSQPVNNPQVLTAQAPAACGTGPITCVTHKDLDNYDFVRMQYAGGRYYACTAGGARYKVHPGGIVRSGNCTGGGGHGHPLNTHSKGEHLANHIFEIFDSKGYTAYTKEVIWSSPDPSWAAYPVYGPTDKLGFTTFGGLGYFYECTVPSKCPPSSRSSSVRSVPDCGHIRCEEFADLNNHDPHKLYYHGSHYTTCGGGSVRIALDGTVTSNGACTTSPPARFLHESDLDGDLLDALKAIGFGLKTPTVDFVEVTAPFSHASPPIRAEHGRPSFVTLGGKGSAFRCDVVECPSSSSSSSAAPPPPSSSSAASIPCGGKPPACSPGESAMCCPTGFWKCWDPNAECPLDCAVPSSASSSAPSHLECRGNACISVPGAGPNLCDPILGCGVTKHTECEAGSCVEKTGPGANRCSGTIPCDTHTKCISNACTIQPGIGTNECSVPLDCAGGSSSSTPSGGSLSSFGSDTSGASSDGGPTHLACVFDACVPVSGAGPDLCNPVLGCGHNAHTECRNNSCEVIIGPGPNECSMTVPCSTFTRCINQSCVVVPGVGVPECNTTPECRTGGSSSAASSDDPEFHTECNLDACILVLGPGQDECDIFLGCGQDTHLECRNNQCVAVPGAGDNECTDDIACNTHSICQFFQCVPQEGPGQNTCSQASDCLPTGSSASSRSTDGPTHTECDGPLCREVPGVGQDQCIVQFGCGTDTHLECSIFDECIEVPGSGPNACSSAGDCVTHTVCRNSQCVVIPGPGQNQCSRPRDCFGFSSASPGSSAGSSDDGEFHLECKDGACQLVPGSGPDTCDVFLGCGIDTHAECIQDLCAELPGQGPNECSPSVPCGSFTRCTEDQTCQLVQGIGDNECLRNDDCTTTDDDDDGPDEDDDDTDDEDDSDDGDPPPPPDNDDEDDSDDEDDTDDDDGDPPPPDNDDEDDGADDDDNPPPPDNDDDDPPPPDNDDEDDDVPFHTECVDDECILVTGFGEDECDVFLGCGVNTHLECNDQQQCIIVDGSGPNTCSDQLECGIVTRCNPITLECERVRGSGQNECLNSTDCGGTVSSASSFSQIVTVDPPTLSSQRSITLVTDNPTFDFPSDRPERTLGCIDDTDCEFGFCLNGECVDCTNSAQCPGFRCISNSCEPCRDDLDCPEGLLCLLGRCVGILDRNRVCGNALVEEGEQCDDGNLTPGDGCNRTCQLEENLVASGFVCGNGVLEDGEECDDRNRRDGDGCSSTCLLEVGICGDGIVQTLLAEQCESSTHDPSLPYLCNKCRFLSRDCGDGILNPGEECDEGIDNSANSDALCRPDCGLARCGDGILDSTEECDDGNRLPDDGCSRLCVLEVEQIPEPTKQPIEIEVAQVERPAFVPVQANFPQFPTRAPLQATLPLAQLQPLIQQQAPVGDTGPATVAIVGAGMAAGWSWVRRRRK